MNILVTGAKGFVGRNLVENLKNIKNGTDKTRPGIKITEIFEYDTGTDESVLDQACQTCSHVFHFAGVNRLKDPADFMEGNCGPVKELLGKLKKYGNSCPVIFASSIQASLRGRFAGSAYGKSKLAAEKLLSGYGASVGAEVFIFRFPNLFGKWCRPDYNCVTATLCHALANDLAYTIHDSQTVLELLYIDDLVKGMLDVLEGKISRSGDIANDPDTEMENHSGGYCDLSPVYHVTLGEIRDLLVSFRLSYENRRILPREKDTFAAKLYSTWLSYLPKEKISCEPDMHMDGRGMFAELLKFQPAGQVSVNVTKPGITRGQHWHNSKWEIFIVVSGHGLVRQRRAGTDPVTGKAYPVLETEAAGTQIKAVYILPGFIHSIVNLSHTQDLVTVIFANETFDRDHPDTFYEEV